MIVFSRRLTQALKYFFFLLEPEKFNFMISPFYMTSQNPWPHPKTIPPSKSQWDMSAGYFLLRNGLHVFHPSHDAFCYSKQLCAGESKETDPSLKRGRWWVMKWHDVLKYGRHEALRNVSKDWLRKKYRNSSNNLFSVPKTIEVRANKIQWD